MSQLQTFRNNYYPHFLATIRLSTPVVIGQLGNVLMGFIDNLMIGELSYVHLSAASLANGIFMIVVIIGIGITMAIAPLVAEVHGANQDSLIGDYLRNGVVVGLACGILLGLIVYFAAELMPYLDQPEEDVVLAMPYTKILSISVIPMMVFLAFKQFADGLSQTRIAMYITLIGLAFNTVANWLLIYGHWGFPRWELDGAGIGTLMSRLLMMTLMGTYVLYGRKFQRYEIQTGWKRFKGKYISKILEIGIPSGFQYFFEAGAFVGAALMVGWIGSAERAAHQIVIQMASISFMVILGVSAGSSIRVGNFMGKKNWVEVQRAGMAGIYLSILFMSGSSLVFLLGRYWLPGWFVDEPFVIQIAAELMLFAALFQIFDGVQAVAVGILRGVQDVKIPTLITFIAYWLINLPLGYLLAFEWGGGVKGIWAAIVFSLLLASTWLTYRFWALTQKKMNHTAATPAVFAS